MRQSLLEQPLVTVSLPSTSCPYRWYQPFDRSVQVGELLLRQYIFIHLSHHGDKFHVLLAMVHKLYAMVMRQCADDNPDALIHHEVQTH